MASFCRCFILSVPSRRGATYDLISKPIFVHQTVPTLKETIASQKIKASKIQTNKIQANISTKTHSNSIFTSPLKWGNLGEIIFARKRICIECHGRNLIHHIHGNRKRFSRWTKPKSFEFNKNRRNQWQIEDFKS